MRTPQTSQTALNAFMSRKAKIDAKLARLQALSDAHFNVSPENVHWGHVGDLGRYTDLLRQITDAAFKEGEHDEHSSTNKFDMLHSEEYIAYREECSWPLNFLTSSQARSTANRK